MYVKETLMIHATKCDSWEKPGKNEILKQLINWAQIKKYPDCDRKRSTICKAPACSRKK